MSGQECWQQGPEAFSLDEREVQIWRLDLSTAHLPLAELEGHLQAEELARAARFHFEADRRRYVATRGTLRILLGRLLALPPADVCLQYGAEGKPHLAGEHESDVKFNVAHSNELALIVLARGAEVGVDVEYARTLEDALHIAQRFFSAQEIVALQTAPVAKREAMFFRIWARKEAFIKATGKGLSQPLGAFNVLAADGKPLSFVELDGAPTPWRLWDVHAGAEYGAALVTWAPGSVPKLLRYRY